MISKKIVAIGSTGSPLHKQGEVLRRKIVAKISGMSPAELQQMHSFALQIRTKRILSGIGRIYDVPFSDGGMTTAVMLTFEGIKEILGVDDVNGIKRVIGEYGKGDADIEEERVIVNKHGILVNLNLHEQIALAKAIVNKRPDLASILGFYNLRASRRVYEVLGVKEKVYERLGVYWIWTADMWVRKKEEADYPDEAIVILEDLEPLEGPRFCFRSVGNDYWLDDLTDLRNHTGAVVLGAQN